MKETSDINDNIEQGDTSTILECKDEGKKYDEDDDASSVEHSSQSHIISTISITSDHDEDDDDDVKFNPSPPTTSITRTQLASKLGLGNQRRAPFSIKGMIDDILDVVGDG